MGDVTLTNNEGVIFTFNDGDIEEIETVITANLDFDAMPLLTPDNALLFDLNGVTKIIEIRGTLTLAVSTRTSVGSTLTIDEQRKWLEKNLNGFQTGLVFNSDYSSTFNGNTWISPRVMISVFRTKQRTSEPNGLPFEITLYIGNV